MGLFLKRSFAGTILWFHLLTLALGKQHHPNHEKKLILTATDNLKNAVAGGYEEKFTFSNRNTCLVSLDTDGSFSVGEWDRKEQENIVIWEASGDHYHHFSSSSQDSMDFHERNDEVEFYLHLDKRMGILAIFVLHPEDLFHDSNDIAQYITWSPIDPINGLKHLYLTDECVLTLEGKNGMMYWNSESHDHYDSSSMDIMPHEPTHHQDEGNMPYSSHMFTEINTHYDHHLDLMDPSLQKKLVLKASKNMQQTIIAGQTLGFKFPGKKECRLNLEPDGNIFIEKYIKSSNTWEHLWNSEIDIEDMHLDKYYLQLDKKGVLALYGSNEKKRPEVVWAFNKPTKGLEFLYINEQCILTLEKKKGIVLWATMGKPIIATHSPVNSPSLPPTIVSSPFDHLFPFPGMNDNSIKIVLDDEKGDVIQAGEGLEYKFDEGKKCRVELEHNGNLYVEKYFKKDKNWKMVWESESTLPYEQGKSFHLEINEDDGVLGIYWRHSKMIWSAADTTDELKYLVMNNECVLMLLKENGSLHWTSDEKSNINSFAPSYSPPVKPKPMKKLILNDSNGAKNIIKGGETREYKFPGQKGCRVTLDKNANLLVESFSKTAGTIDLVWESFSGIDDRNIGRVFLKLNKKDQMLAIYGGGKPVEIFWDANGPSKGLKFLYIDDHCVLTLETQKGDVHWSSKDDNIPPPPLEYLGPFISNHTKSLVLTASLFSVHPRYSMKSGQMRDYWFMNGNKCSLILERNGNLMVKSYQMSTDISNEHVIWESNSGQTAPGDFVLHFVEDVNGSLVIASIAQTSTNIDSSSIIWSITPNVRDLKYLFMNDKCELTLEVEDIKWSSVSTESPSTTPSATPSAIPSVIPTISPTSSPTLSPTEGSTHTVSAIPTVMMTSSPTLSPTAIQTLIKSSGPTLKQNTTASVHPSLSPSVNVVNMTNEYPSSSPSIQKSMSPTMISSVVPSSVPSMLGLDHSNVSHAPTIAPSVNHSI